MSNCKGDAQHMIMLKVMEKRKSVHEYKHKSINEDTMQDLMSKLEERPDMHQAEDVDFVLLEDGKHVFENLKGADGINSDAIKAPHYMAVLAEKTSHYLMVAGYLAEWFILQATRLDIGTCWIETANMSDRLKNVLNIESSKQIVGLITMGYAKGEHNNTDHNTSQIGRISPFTNLGYSNIETEVIHDYKVGSKSVDNIVYMNKWGRKSSVEKLKKYGLAEVFYYMRMAPSWRERQPWKFIVSGEYIVLLIDRSNLVMEDETENYIVEIDAGIAMIYFEVAMHCEGLPGHWMFDCDTTMYEIPENYFIAGCYTYSGWSPSE